MIRFVRIQGLDKPAFAWFDTVPDRFMEFSGEHVFESWTEFEEAWGLDPRYTLIRFRALFQETDPILETAREIIDAFDDAAYTGLRPAIERLRELIGKGED